MSAALSCAISALCCANTTIAAVVTASATGSSLSNHTGAPEGVAPAQPCGCSSEHAEVMEAHQWKLCSGSIQGDRS